MDTYCLILQNVLVGGLENIKVRKTKRSWIVWYEGRKTEKVKVSHS